MLKYQQQSSSTVVADDWKTFCNKTLNRPGTLCGSVATSIAASYAGGMGRRAGALCLALGDCVADMGNNCSISTTLLATNKTTSGAISLCTAEGIQAGAALPGVGLDKDRTASHAKLVAAGRCLTTQDCNDPNLMCSSTSTPQTQLCLCTAATGLDDCTTYGTCVRTPCKVCSDCLSLISTGFISQQLYATDSFKVANSFYSFCTATGLASGTLCMSVAGSVNGSIPTGNKGEHGGMARAFVSCHVVLREK